MRRRFVLEIGILLAGAAGAIAGLALADALLLRIALVVMSLAPSVIVAYLTRILEPRRASVERLERLLTYGTLVRDANPYDGNVGVSKSDLASPYKRPGEARPPYVPREADRELDSALKDAVDSGRLTIVLGPSNAGKSRTAFEAVARLFPDRPIILPDEGEISQRPLQALLDVDPSFRLESPGPVLWLDDLERYVRSGDLRPGTIGALRARYPGLVSVGTIRLDEFAYLHESRDVERKMRGLFDPDLVHQIFLDRDLTTSEQSGAEAHYGDLAKRPEFKALGKYLVAAEELTLRYEAARKEHPIHRAIVDAAIGWRRAGISGPIPEADLRELAAALMAERTGVASLDDASLSAAIAWATEPGASSTALLAPVAHRGGRAFVAFDYLYEYTTDRVPVSEAVWRFVFRRATKDDHREIARAAQRAGRLAKHDDLARAIAGSEGRAAAWASLYLAMLAAEGGRFDEARDGYGSAVASGYEDVQALAHVHLGRLLAAEGDLGGAEACWRRAEALSDEEAAAEAGFHLGVLLMGGGDVPGAEAAWRRAAAHPEEDGGQRAARRLGEHYLRSNRPAEAVAALLHAGEQDPSGATLALRALARVHVRQWSEAMRDADAASKTLVRALGADPAGPAHAWAVRGAAQAHVAGAIARLKLGLVTEAMIWAEEGVRVAKDDARAWATLSQVALAAGDLPRSVEAAQRCHDIDGDGTLGLRSLAEVALAQNDVSTAVSYAGAAVGRFPDEVASWLLLGRVLRRSGDHEAALDAFGEAMEVAGGVEWYDDEAPLEWAFRYVARRSRIDRIFLLVELGANALLLVLAGLLASVAVYSALVALGAYPAVAVPALGLVGWRLFDVVRRRRARAREAGSGTAGDVTAPGPGATLRRDIRLVQRAASLWWPCSSALLFLLGAESVVSALARTQDAANTPVFGIVAMTLALLLLVPPWRARQSLGELAPARLTKLRAASATSIALSQTALAGAALLLYVALGFIISALEDEDARQGDQASGIWLGGALTFWAVLVAWRWVAATRTAAKPSARSSEEDLIRRARSKVLRLMAVVGAAALGTILVQAVTSGVRLGHLAGAVYVGVGVGAFLRWWSARRAVLRLPQGSLLLRRSVVSRP